MSSKSKSKISVKELVLYIICGAFILWGLVYIILGLLASYLPLAQSANPLFNANLALKNTFGLGFLGWGLILTGSFAVIFAGILLYFAKGTDKNLDKDQRRAARLAARNKTPKEEAPVVDLPVEEAKE